jgi:ribosomal-protein-alanine N-acetyltransferase
MSGIEIVEAGPGHTAVLARLHRKCLGVAWSGQSIGDLLALPGSFALLALAGAGGKPAGFALCIPGGDGIEIAALGMLPRQRRRGGGRRLVEAIVARATADGVSEIALEVAEDNLPAQRLYGACGFVTIARRPGYYAARGFGDRRDALVMRIATGSELAGNQH